MRLMGQSCRCDDPAFPDCFGCPVLVISIPTAWQLDFPTAMTYQYGATTGSCSTTTTTTTPAFFPWETVRTKVDSATIELPDMTTLGVPSILDLDQNALTDSYGPWTQCIWASNEFLLYEQGSITGAVSGVVGCPTAGYAPASFLGDEYTGVDAWEYASHGNLTPPAFSQNRQRTTLSSTDYRCGTTDYPGCTPWTVWSCSFKVFGVYGLLTVVTSGASYVFTLKIFWWPRVNRRIIITEYDHNTSTGATTASRYVSGSRDQRLNTLDIPTACMTSTFPAATSLSNLSQGILLRYEKTVDCDTDFLGTPVVLSLAEEYSAYSGASQTKCEALGISNVPSTVTITAL